MKIIKQSHRTSEITPRRYIKYRSPQALPSQQGEHHRSPHFILCALWSIKYLFFDGRVKPNPNPKVPKWAGIFQTNQFDADWKAVIKWCKLMVLLGRCMQLGSMNFSLKLEKASLKGRTNEVPLEEVVAENKWKNYKFKMRIWFRNESGRKFG